MERIIRPTRMRQTVTTPIFVNEDVLHVRKIRDKIKKQIKCGDIYWDDKGGYDRLGAWRVRGDYDFIAEGQVGSVFSFCVRLGHKRDCGYVVKIQSIRCDDDEEVLEMENELQNILHNMTSVTHDPRTPYVPPIFDLDFDTTRLSLICDDVLDSWGNPMRGVKAGVTVMSKVKGVTLDSLLSKSRTLPPHAMKHIIDRVFESVDYLHDRGFQHGDLNPKNVMIDVDRNDLFTPDVSGVPIGISFIDISLPVQVEDLTDRTQFVDRPYYYDYITMCYYITNLSRSPNADPDVLRYMYEKILDQIDRAWEFNEPNLEVYGDVRGMYEDFTAIFGDDFYGVMNNMHPAYRPRHAGTEKVLKTFSHFYYPYTDVCSPPPESA